MLRLEQLYLSPTFSVDTGKKHCKINIPINIYIGMRRVGGWGLYPPIDHIFFRKIVDI